MASPYPTYLELLFEATEDKQELLIAALELLEAGFEGYQQEVTHVHAFIPEPAYQPDVVLPLAQKLGCPLTEVRKHPWTNWNTAWEQAYGEVEVGSFCHIHPAFRPAKAGFTYTVEIQPQMSFGTGHHATTQLMVQQLQALGGAVRGRRVLDMGAGTGVLGILAAKMEAAEVVFVDIDQWAKDNCEENLQRNGFAPQSDRFTVLEVKASSLRGMGAFDLILANINTNVLLQDGETYVNHLAAGGYIVLSGFLGVDAQRILSYFKSLQLQPVRSLEQAEWHSLCLQQA